MKIKGWEKISGYTYKGYTMVNPMHNADETKYEATILNLNLPQKPKCELNVITNKHKFRGSSENYFLITLYDSESKASSCMRATTDMMNSLVNFRGLIETMIDELIDTNLKIRYNAK